MIGGVGVRRAGPPAVAVVPLRDGRSGKTRLAASLTAADRGALVVVLARHVVSTLVAAADVVEVVVVSEDPASARGALDGVVGPVRVVRQPPTSPGLDAAVDVGRALVLRERPAARLLVVHADLPALQPDDVAALLRAAARAGSRAAARAGSRAAARAGSRAAGSVGSRAAGSVGVGIETPGPAHASMPGGPDGGAAEPAGGVALASDRAGTGTNAVVLDPARADFAFRFGPGSLQLHWAEAAARGLGTTVVRRGGTACDLDTEADWQALPAPVRRRVTRAVPAMADLPAIG